jgi:hypothetical protein
MAERWAIVDRPPLDPNDPRSWHGVVRKISSNVWIADGKLIVTFTRSIPRSGAYLADLGFSGFWSFRDVRSTDELPTSTPLTTPDMIAMNTDATYDGDHGYWRVGSVAVIKIKHFEPGYWLERTREHTTINYVRQQSPSFAVPEVIHHLEYEGGYILVTTRLGEQASPHRLNASLEARMNLQRQIVDAIVEMAAWKGTAVAGVDGGDHPDWALFVGLQRDHKSGPAVLQDLGVDCTEPVFYNGQIDHLGVVVNDRYELVGFQDWDECGFVPRAWIIFRTIEVPNGLTPVLSNLAVFSNVIRRTGLVSMCLELRDRGFPNEVHKFEPYMRAIEERVAKSEKLKRDEGISYGMTGVFHPVFDLPEKKP